MKHSSRIWVLLVAILFVSSCGKDVAKSEGGSLIPVIAESAYQYVNDKGEVKITAQFKSATVFRENLALVEAAGSSSKWGYINSKGIYIINPKYAKATIFNEGIAWAMEEGQSITAINPKGETLFVLPNASEVMCFREGLAAFCEGYGEDKKWGFINTKGEVVITPQFSDCGSFKEGYCAVAFDNDKWGYINSKGIVVIAPEYEEAGKFLNGAAIVELNNKIGVINSQGNFIINPIYDWVNYDDEWFIVVRDKMYGWCDKSGKTVITPQFTGALNFNGNNIAPATTDSLYGYIDKKGKFQIQPQFDIALPFSDNIGIVSLNDRYGFIDITGKFVVNPIYKDMPGDLLYYLNNNSTEHFKLDKYSN